MWANRLIYLKTRDEYINTFFDPKYKWLRDYSSLDTDSILKRINGNFKQQDQVANISQLNLLTFLIITIYNITIG